MGEDDSEACSEAAASGEIPPQTWLVKIKKYNSDCTYDVEVQNCVGSMWKSVKVSAKPCQVNPQCVTVTTTTTTAAPDASTTTTTAAPGTETTTTTAAPGTE